MKKYYYIAMAAIAVLTISCSKTDPQNTREVVEPTLVTVKGIVSDEKTDTKTDYDIDWGNKVATFYWKGAEEFSRIYWNSSYVYREFYSGNADSSGETEITFSGLAVSNDSGYAFYPSVNQSNFLGWSSGDASNFKLELNATSAYDYANPIKGLVPMIGKLNSGGTAYDFRPVVGVLAVRLTNIPAEATSIKISSPNTTTGGFSGLFSTNQTVVNYKTGIGNAYDNGISFSSGTTNGASRSFTFSNLTSAQTYYFYFPTPVGDLNGLQIELCDATGTFYTVTSSKAVTSTRGTITRLPLITVPTAPSATITGDLNNRTAIFEKNGAEKIKYGIATSSSTKLSEISSTTTASTSVAVAPGATGTYYLVYQGYKDDETTKVGPEKRVQFIYVSNNVADVAGTYLINNNTTYGFSFTIAAISPVTDGKNIKITAYNSYTDTYDSSGICSGVLNPATGTITIPSAQTLASATKTFCLIGFSGDVSTSAYNSYDDDFVLNIVAIDNDAALRFNCNKICVTENTNVDTGNKKFKSSGQHFTSDGYGGSVFLYKSK